jgi:hypothetical protein
MARQDLPIQPVPRRSGFAAEVQRLVASSQFAQQPDNRIRRVVERAEIPHLAVAVRFCHGDRIVHLGRTDPDEDLAQSAQAASDLNSSADMRSYQYPSADRKSAHCLLTAACFTGFKHVKHVRELGPAGGMADQGHP